MLFQNTPHGLLVDFLACNVRDEHGDLRTPVAWIPFLRFDNELDQFIGRTFATRTTLCRISVQPSILPRNQCPVQVEQRRLGDGNGSPLDTTGRHHQGAQ